MLLSQTRKANFVSVWNDMNGRGNHSSSHFLQGLFQRPYRLCCFLASQSILCAVENEKPRGSIEANRIGWDVDVGQECEQVHGLTPLRHSLTCRDCRTERDEIRNFFTRFGEQEPQSSLPLDPKGASGDGCIWTWKWALWGWVRVQIPGRIWSCLATSLGPTGLWGWVESKPMIPCFRGLAKVWPV